MHTVPYMANIKFAKTNDGDGDAMRCDAMVPHAHLSTQMIRVRQTNFMTFIQCTPHIMGYAKP